MGETTTIKPGCPRDRFSPCATSPKPDLTMTLRHPSLVITGKRRAAEGPWTDVTATTMWAIILTLGESLGGVGGQEAQCNPAVTSSMTSKNYFHLEIVVTPMYCPEYNFLELLNICCCGGLVSKNLKYSNFTGLPS